MRTDVLVAITLAVSGVSAIHAFAMSVREDMLLDLLSRFRRTAAMFVSLGVDFFVLLLVIVGASSLSVITGKLVSTGYLEDFAHSLKYIVVALLVAVFVIRFITQSLGLIREEFKELKAK